MKSNSSQLNMPPLYFATLQHTKEHNLVAVCTYKYMSLSDFCLFDDLSLFVLYSTVSYKCSPQGNKTLKQRSRRVVERQKNTRNYMYEISL